MYLTLIRRIRLGSSVPVRVNFHISSIPCAFCPCKCITFAPPTPLPGSFGAYFLALALQAKKYKPFLFRQLGRFVHALLPTLHLSGTFRHFRMRQVFTDALLLVWVEDSPENW